MKKHAFVICAYKVSPYLEYCIASLMNQSGKSKIVIATSTPNKHIYGVAHKYGLDVVENPDGPKGIGYDFDFALKTGIQMADYVTVVHQDDAYRWDYRKRILECMDEDTIIAFTNYHEERKSGIVKSNINLKIKRCLLWMLKFKIFQKSIFIRRRILGCGNAICCPSVTFNSSKIEMPLFANEFKSNVDWYAWEQLSRVKGRFVYLSKDLTMHRVHEESTTTEIIRENIRGREDLAMMQMFWPSFFARIVNKFYSLAEKSNT